MSNDLVHIYEDKCVKMLFSTKNNMSKDHKLHTYIFLTHFMERYHVKKKKFYLKMPENLELVRYARLIHFSSYNF